MRLGRLVLPYAESWSPRSGVHRFGGLLCEPGDLDADGVAAVGGSVVRLAGSVDEPVVPIVSDQWSGFGRVVDAEVDFGSVGLAVGHGTYQVDVEPVSDGPVRVHSVVSGSARPAPSPPDEFRGWCAAPGSAGMWSFRPFDSAGRVDVVRDCEGGGVRYSSMAGVFDAAPSWVCDPGGWYEGGAQVEVLIGGSWVPVVGRTVLDRSRAWRVTNRLIRWTVTPDDRLEVQWWREGSWRTTRVWHLICYLAGRIPWSRVEVTRNSPAAVTIRLTGELTRGDGGWAEWWLTVRRGSTALDMHVRSAADPAFQLVPIPTGAVTDSGSHITSATVDGVAWVGMAAGAWSGAPSSGIMHATPITTTRAWSFAVAGQMPGVASFGVEVVRAWYAAGTERLTVGGV